MAISKTNTRSLLLDIHQNIEEYADQAASSISDLSDFNFLAYPPNCGFTNAELNELNKLNINEDLKNALRKIIADASAGVIFNLLNTIDGTTDLKNDNGEWMGIKLAEEKPVENSEPETDFLHDRFYETYWDWKILRGNKTWKLDFCEE